MEAFAKVRVPASSDVGAARSLGRRAINTALCGVWPAHAVTARLGGSPTIVPRSTLQAVDDGSASALTRLRHSHSAEWDAGGRKFSPSPCGRGLGGGDSRNIRAGVPLPPTPSRKGRGRVFSARRPISKCVNAVGLGGGVARNIHAKSPLPPTPPATGEGEFSTLPRCANAVAMTRRDPCATPKGAVIVACRSSLAPTLARPTIAH